MRASGLPKHIAVVALLYMSLMPASAFAEAVAGADIAASASAPVAASAALPALERLFDVAAAPPAADDADPFAIDQAALATAVYDISAHVVVMPDGARLEAHSGWHDRVDDPRYIRERMRGPTPPALYDLALREHLFHGVAALRLKPVSGDVFGRAGLLAHTYMLRGRAESNGCVVFRDYPAFLKAFLLGHIKHLRVVPGIGEAALRIA